MKPSDALLLRIGGSPASTPCCCVPTVSSCAPQNVGSLDVPSLPREVPDSAFNSLTPSDVLFLQSFRNSDSLHRSDSIAREQSRGARLKSWLKENGASKFNSKYGF